MKNHEDIAFDIFAELHPVEAYETYPDKFKIFLKDKGYNLTTEQIEKIIEEIEEVP